jgi:hypothetical protein
MSLFTTIHWPNGVRGPSKCKEFRMVNAPPTQEIISKLRPKLGGLSNLSPSEVKYEYSIREKSKHKNLGAKERIRLDG